MRDVYAGTPAVQTPMAPWDAVSDRAPFRATVYLSIEEVRRAFETVAADAIGSGMPSDYLLGRPKGKAVK